MSQLMRLPAYEVPQNALMNYAPINQGLATIREVDQQNRQYGLQQEQLGMQRERFGMEKKQFDAEQARRTVEQIAGIAQAADRETDPVRRAMIFKRALQMHPGYRTGEIDKSYLDPINGPKLLMAEAAKYADPATRAKTEAEIDQTRAHADYFRAGAANLRARAGAAAGAPAAPSAPAPDPLAGYGLDENGEIVGGAPASDPRFQWPGADGAAPAYGVPMPRPARPAGMMRLGGPPEQDQQQQQRRPGGDDGMPALMKQSIEQTFGPAGRKSNEVPGVVTTGGNRATSDPYATRAADGQRAYEGASPEQQARLRDLRQQQAFWTHTYGRPPRAGHYYGKEGNELPLSEKNYKGDREQQGLIKLNLDKIDEAHKSLKDQTFGYTGRAVSGTLNYGQNARAFEDLKQAAMNIAYVLSGKTVGKAEFENFMAAYAPKPLDSVETMDHKVKRMKEFFRVLQTARASGLPEEQAWAKASTGMFAADTPKPNPERDRLKAKYGLE